MDALEIIHPFKPISPFKIPPSSIAKSAEKWLSYADK